MMSASSVSGRKPRWRLLLSENYEMWMSIVTGQARQREAADRYGVDRSAEIERLRSPRWPSRRWRRKTFVSSIQSLTEQAEAGLGEMENMTKAIEPVEQGSRSARPVLRKLRKAVTLLTEGRTVTRVGSPI